MFFFETRIFTRPIIICNFFEVIVSDNWRQLSGSDNNTFVDSDIIEPKIFTGASLKNDVISLTIPPFSLVVFEVK
jgi:hypothetical protein